MDHLSEAQQAERRRCVLTDAARKRNVRRWTNCNLSPPPSLLRREVEEFDRRHGLLASPRPVLRFEAGSSSRVGCSSGPRRYEAGSSSTAPSSRTPMTPKREEEDGFEGYDPALFAGAIGPEDFIPDAAYDAVNAMMLALSEGEAEEEQARRDEAAAMGALLLQQGLDGERAHREKEEEWQRVKAEQDRVFIDLCSDEE